MCCLNGCQGPRAWGCVCSDPSSHPDSIHNQEWRVWEKGEDREERQSEREREAAFVTAETTVFVPLHHGGTRATNVKQTKARGTSMPGTHICTLIDFLLQRHRNKKSDSGDPVCAGRGWGGKKLIYKQTMRLCACVPLHACMRASTQTRTMEADWLWLVPLQ